MTSETTPARSDDILMHGIDARDRAPFVAGQLSTSLDEAVAVSVGVDEAPRDALVQLERKDFQQAPVRDGGNTVGWVHVDQLRRGEASVGEVMTPLSRTPIVAASTSLSEAFPALREGFVFTVHRAGLSGFIVPSDLDRQVVRAHFYVVIAEIEMCLAEVVNAYVPAVDVEAQLLAKPNSREAKRFREAREKEQDTRIVEYLYLRDLITLFMGRPGANVPDGIQKTLDGLNDFRNVVMHPTKPLVAEYPVDQLTDLDRQIRVARNYVYTTADELGPEGWFDV